MEIRWTKRSLKSFGDASLDELACQYDLLVIDHPYVGYLSSRQVVQPLETHLLSGGLLEDLRDNSVGPSFESYCFADRLWAVPLDAAAPVSSWRPDLLDRHGIRRPESWEQLLELARKGFVAFPATPVDSLMNFFMLCCGLGEDPFETATRVVSEPVGLRALQLLRELTICCSPECLERNPIQIYREMVTGDRIMYCPFAFGYSNYARTGYARNTLKFGGLVRYEGQVLRSTLGGAGLAVSVSCSNLKQTLEYLRFVVSAQCQRSLYTEAGGQPAHRSAWKNPEANRLCSGFFEDTIQVLDSAFLRPRHDGYLGFQELGGNLVHSYLRSGGDPGKIVSALNQVAAHSYPTR